MAAKRHRKMMKARTSFAYGDGYHVVHKGELLADDHAAVRANPNAFEETEFLRPEVEQATAAPGEKRGE